MEAPQAPQHPGKIVAERLKEAGWTRQDFAFITGFSLTTINRVCAGRFFSIRFLHVLLQCGPRFGPDAHYWIHLWNSYRIAEARKDPKIARSLKHIKKRLEDWLRSSTCVRLRDWQ